MKKLLIVLMALLMLSCKGGDCAEKSVPPGSPATRVGKNNESRSPCLNINTATAAELMTLPGVGEVRAKKIIAHRERYGPFRRPQEIIIIDGFSERRYRALADLICVE